MKEQEEKLRAMIIAEGIDTPVEEVIKSLKDTLTQFDLDLTLEELWEQEKPFYRNYGVSAYTHGMLDRETLDYIE